MRSRGSRGKVKPHPGRHSEQNYNNLISTNSFHHITHTFIYQKVVCMIIRLVENLNILVALSTQNCGILYKIAQGVIYTNKKRRRNYNRKYNLHKRNTKTICFTAGYNHQFVIFLAFFEMRQVQRLVTKLVCGFFFFSQI